MWGNRHPSGSPVETTPYAKLSADRSPIVPRASYPATFGTESFGFATRQVTKSRADFAVNVQR